MIGWAFFETGALPLIAVLAIEGAFATWLAGRVRRVLAEVDERGHDLVLLAELLDRLEREPFQSALLRRLRQSLETEGHPASVQIRRLARLLHLLDTQKNQFFMPFAAVWLWRTQLAMAVDSLACRRGAGDRRVAAAVGEFEALCALAAYSAENPADPFPEIVTGETVLRGREPGPSAHPRGRVRAERRPTRRARFVPWWSAARTCRARARCSARWAWPR